MLWTSSRAWAPSIVVAVQSHSPYLIEIGLYCIVALIVCVAIVIRTPSWAFSALLGSGLTPTTLASTVPEPLLDDAREDIATDDADRFPAGEAVGAGDCDAVRSGPWRSDATGPAQTRGFRADSGAGLEADTTAVVFLSCAACQRARRGQDADDAVSLAPSTAAPIAMKVTDDVDEELFLSVDDESSMSSLEEGSEADPSVKGDEVDEQLGEGVMVDAVPQGGMVEYVSARYQGFKKAVLAGKLLVVDPVASPLLSESDLVAILSHALGAPIAKRRGFPGG